MSFIIPSNVATSSDDLKSIGVKENSRVRVNTAVGVKDVALSPDQAQQYYAGMLVKKNKRSVNKYIWALFTASGNATAILGDAFGATTYADANGTWSFQNGASAGANALTCFKNMIRAQPFDYVGIQIDVSAYSIFGTATWTEVITDYDANFTPDWSPKVNAALTTIAQISTTRYLRVAGQFSGNWGLYITGLTNGQTVKFTFNCVNIQRTW